jgi:integrase
MTVTHPAYETALKWSNERAAEFVDPEDAARLERMCKAYDSDNLVVECPDGQRPKAVNTLRNYVRGLTRVAQHVSLTEATAEEFNEVFQGFYDGSLNPDRGPLKKGTIRTQQNAVRQFLYAFPDSVADPEGIPLFRPEDRKVDPEQMLTREEIQACRDAAEGARDLALFDFLLYTGQRNTATRTLRIRDLDLENGRFRLNADANGLKGAEKNGKWRDLLLSAASIRTYLRTDHPAPDNPDTYVFTHRPDSVHKARTGPLKKATITDSIKRTAARASESCPSIASKPVRPHYLRHNFVTIALRRGMPESAIKHQIGHAPESTVMETTYAHLKDSDHIRAARESFGLETEPAESELTPEICPRCGENPPSTARLCPWCGLEFTPEAREVLNNADEALRESYRRVDPADTDAVEKLQIVDDLLADPAVREVLLKRAGSGE